MPKIYYDKDADFDVYKDRTIGIIGYGIQGRGQAGERQVDNNLILVTGNGGVLNYHANLLLSPEAA